MSIQPIQQIDCYWWRGEREIGKGVREAEKVEVGERVREAESTATRRGSEKGREAEPERVDC